MNKQSNLKDKLEDDELGGYQALTLLLVFFQSYSKFYKRPK